MIATHTTGAAPAGPASHRPCWARRAAGKVLGLGAATAMVAGVLASAVLGSAATASASTTRTGWLMGAGTLAGVTAQDNAAAGHFLNAPATFATGSSLTGSPVQPGVTATPVLAYTSYAQFAADFHGARVNFPYQWVMYDPEEWNRTPVAEQQAPVRYMTLFGRLAHALGLKVIMAPAMDLGYVPGSVSPRVAGETIVHWYLRANIAGAAAASGDIVNIQGESQTTSLQQYDALYNAGAAQARTANPSVKVFDEVSTVNGTAQQMAAAAESVTADGYYVAAPNALTQADQFFQTMKNAGY